MRIQIKNGELVIYERLAPIGLNLIILEEYLANKCR